jgi:ribose transport system permease protein
MAFTVMRLTQLNNRLSLFLADYGMVVVLLLLCAFFTVLTWSEQHPGEAAAAKDLAQTIVAEAGRRAHVLIVVRPAPKDELFAAALRQELESRGATVTGVVSGQPPEARQAIAKLMREDATVDVFACNRASSVWGIYDKLRQEFPALRTSRVVRPESYYWPNFLKADNLLNIANQIAVIAIMAIGMTMVIIAGGIDLSVGSLIAVSAIVAARLLRDVGGGGEASGLTMVWCSAVGILVCGLAGLFSGVMVTQFRVPSFIVTLAVMLSASGIAYDLSEGQSINQVPETYVWLGRGADFLGIPNAVVLMLVLYVLAHVLMTRTVLGRYIYAVGGNVEAARLSGVPVRRVVWTVFTISGLLAGLGGIILASQLKSGGPTYGQMYEMFVIAAAVVGGTSLSGGKGKIFGTLVGAFIIAVIQNGMNLVGLTSYRQREVFGAVILGAVILDQLKKPISK